MKVRHLEWLIGEPVADPEEAIVYGILPYSPVQADLIIRHLCALVELDLEQASDDPARADRVRQAFGLIVDAACAREALLDLNKIERGVGKAPWRDRLRDLRHDRGQFATAIGDKSVRNALRWALIDIGQAPRAGRRWLHYLLDHPAVLRKTIDRALEARILRDETGRADRLDRVLLVEGVGRAYELLTGKPLGRSRTPEGTPTGPGVRLVWTCLEPLDPIITDDAVLWAIRRAKQEDFRNRLARLNNSAP